MITDTHTHLYSSQFKEDQLAMIQRAKDAGVSRFFIPAIDSSYTESMMKQKVITTYKIAFSNCVTHSFIIKVNGPHKKSLHKWRLYN